MTLQELADYCNALLEDGHDPSARVLIAEQPHWPFEYRLDGMCTRDDLKEYHDHDGDVPEEDSEFELREEQKQTDVVLAAGSQLCYGDQNTWEVARKYPR